MRTQSIITPCSQSTNLTEEKAGLMNSANPRQPQDHRFLRSAILMLVVSFLLGAHAQAEQIDGFQVVKGGMKVKTVEAGKGPVATKGMIATIHFISWIDNAGVRGEEIYNSRLDGEPISFVIGTDKVMPAWNEGVQGMQVGGKRKLLVPPNMAYGNRAIDDVIPANASMQFIIELIALKK